MRFRFTGLFVVGLASVLLAGCVGAATEGINIARDKRIVSSNIEAARAGDAEAQYKVGDALCCSVNEGSGFYNTPQSVQWLCKAAAQNHGKAAMKLGEIYEGDVVSGVRVLRRVAQRVAGSSTDPAVAYAWFRRAEALGVDDAKTSAQEVWDSMTPPVRERAEAMERGQTILPCLWNEVFAHAS